MLRSGTYVLGPDVEAFEAEAANYLGVEHSVGLNSGTDALVIGLRALGVRPGDEVVTTPFTFFATAESVSLVGARPVFVDIDPLTLNMDAALLEAAVTDRTAAIIPVHLFGRPAVLDDIGDLARRHDLRILEDAAQAFGAWVGTGGGRRKVGGVGDAGAFSFYPTKNLGGFGDGGLLVTDDDDVAVRARMLRNHGDRSRYRNETLGYNSRLDALQAALLRVKLRRLDEFNEARRRAAARYEDLLSPLAEAGVLVRPGHVEGHVFHQYTVRILPPLDRDAVRERLRAEGVETMVYYPIPCHRLPAYGDEYRDARLPEAERAAREVLSLPIWPAIEPDTQERVADALTNAVRA